MRASLDEIIHNFQPSLEVSEEREVKERLPIMYRSFYNFKYAVISGVKFLVCYVKDFGLGPRQIKLHSSFLTDNFSLPIIWLFESLDSSKVQRLIENEINFIVKGKYLNLPFFYKSMRFKPQRKIISLSLTPVAIKMINREIVKGDLSGKNQKEISELISESQTLVGRAAEKIKTIFLAFEKKDGRSKKLFFVERDELISYVKDQYYSPVESTLYINVEPELALSGDSLLVKETMLVSGELKTFAVGKKNLFDFVGSVCDEEDAKAKIEVWRWDPNMGNASFETDPIGFYFSVKSNKDERVQLSLEDYLIKYNLKGLR